MSAAQIHFETTICSRATRINTEHILLMCKTKQNTGTSWRCYRAVVMFSATDMGLTGSDSLSKGMRKQQNNRRSASLKIKLEIETKKTSQSLQVG